MFGHQVSHKTFFVQVDDALLKQRKVFKGNTSLETISWYWRQFSHCSFKVLNYSYTEFL